MEGVGCVAGWGAHQQRRPRPRPAPPPKDARPLSCFRVSGFGFRNSVFGFRVLGFGIRLSGSGFRAQVLGLSPVGRVAPFRRLRAPPRVILYAHTKPPPSDETPLSCFRDSGFGIRLSGFGIRVQGLGLRGSEVVSRGARRPSPAGCEPPQR